MKDLQRAKLKSPRPLESSINQSKSYTLGSCRKICWSAQSSCQSRLETSSKLWRTRNRYARSTKPSTTLSAIHCNPCSCTAWVNCNHRLLRQWKSPYRQQWCSRWRSRVWQGRLIPSKNSSVEWAAMERQSIRAWSMKCAAILWRTTWWSRRAKSVSLRSKIDSSFELQLMIRYLFGN